MEDRRDRRLPFAKLCSSLCFIRSGVNAERKRINSPVDTSLSFFFRMELSLVNWMNKFSIECARLSRKAGRGEKNSLLSEISKHRRFSFSAPKSSGKEVKKLLLKLRTFILLNSPTPTGISFKRLLSHPEPPNISI